MKKSEKKTVFEAEKGRTKITVCRVFGEQSILDLYSEYVAETVRAQRREAEAAKKSRMTGLTKGRERGYNEIPPSRSARIGEYNEY